MNERRKRKGFRLFCLVQALGFCGLVERVG